jgi:hypothetical protein
MIVLGKVRNLTAPKLPIAAVGKGSRRVSGPRLRSPAAPAGAESGRFESPVAFPIAGRSLWKLAAWGPLSRLLASGLIVATTLPVRALANHPARKRTEHRRVRRQGQTPNSEITSAHIQIYSRSKSVNVLSCHALCGGPTYGNSASRSLWGASPSPITLPFVSNGRK